MKETKNLLLKNYPYLILLIFVVITMLDVFYLPALRFLSGASAIAITNLSLASGIKILITGIPVLKGSAEIIDKVFGYLVFINEIIFFQLILLKISQCLIVKLLLLAGLILLWFDKIKRIAAKILIALLLFNPGLSFYLISVEYISNTTKLESGELVRAHMESVEKKKTEDKRKSQIEEKKEGERKNIFVIVGDFLIDIFNSIKNTIVDVANKTKAFVGESILRLLELVINYLISVILLFIVLPFLYFILLYLILKNVFTKLNEQDIREQNRMVYILIPLKRSKNIFGR